MQSLPNTTIVIRACNSQPPFELMLTDVGFDRTTNAFHSAVDLLTVYVNHNDERAVDKIEEMAVLQMTDFIFILAVGGREYRATIDSIKTTQQVYVLNFMVIPPLDTRPWWKRFLAPAWVQRWI